MCFENKETLKKKRIQGFLPVSSFLVNEDVLCWVHLGALAHKFPNLPDAAGLPLTRAPFLGRSHLQRLLFLLQASVQSPPRAHVSSFMFPPPCGPVSLFFQHRECKQGADAWCSQSTRKPCPSRVFGPPLGDHLPSLPVGQCPEFSQDGADGVALRLGLGGGLTEPYPAPHPSWPAANAAV